MSCGAIGPSNCRGRDRRDYRAGPFRPDLTDFAGYVARVGRMRVVIFERVPKPASSSMCIRWWFTPH